MAKSPYRIQMFISTTGDVNAAPFPFLGTLPSQGHQRDLLGEWMHNSPYLSAYSLHPIEQRTSSFTWAEVAMKQL